MPLGQMEPEQMRSTQFYQSVIIESVKRSLRIISKDLRTAAEIHERPGWVSVYFIPIKSPKRPNKPKKSRVY